MSILYIAEKPSLGRAIAQVLPKPHRNHQGYIEVGNGDRVTWCIGHLLEQAMPEQYDTRYQRWRLDDLPIFPEPWQLTVKSSGRQQLAVIRRLLKDAKHVIHAGDPDREGQLLVDEVLNHCHLKQAQKHSVQRLLVNDLNPNAVRQSLKRLRSNREFMSLSISALARSRADWLYGMNMSRAYTLLGQQYAYQGVLSVGRVQTPVLGLVVRRDLERETFQSVDYFQVDAVIDCHGERVTARWQPSDSCAPWQDDAGHVLAKTLAEHVCTRIRGQLAKVMACDDRDVKQPAPLPYSLSALQIDAAKRYRMDAARVLDICQQLYEKHQVITYPRSDCRYLPKDHWLAREQVSQAISQHDTTLQALVNRANLTLKNRAWRDEQVGAHHAIIPTAKVAAKLNAEEAKIYQLIARQYMMQFFDPAQFAQRQLRFEIAGGTFVAKAKVLLNAGWRQCLEPIAKSGSTSHQDTEPCLPQLTPDESYPCIEQQLLAKQTEPPAAFTDASLLQAMTGIARFVRDPQLKTVLRETDGLGTEATRASILQTLFERQLLQKKRQQIQATAAGRALISALPEWASYPDMTAQWEQKLQLMTEKKISYQQFMLQLTSQINALMDQIKVTPAPVALKELVHLMPSPPRAKSSGSRQRAGKKTGANRSRRRSHSAKRARKTASQ